MVLFCLRGGTRRCLVVKGQGELPSLEISDAPFLGTPATSPNQNKKRIKHSFKIGWKMEIDSAGLQIYLGVGRGYFLYIIIISLIHSNII